LMVFNYHGCHVEHLHDSDKNLVRMSLEGAWIYIGESRDGCEDQILFGSDKEHKLDIVRMQAVLPLTMKMGEMSDGFEGKGSWE